MDSDMGSWLTGKRIHQAFSAAPIFLIDDLISITETRLNDMADHLYFLQCVPAYMRRYIKVLHGGVLEMTNPSELQDVSTLLCWEILIDILTCWQWRWIKMGREHVKSVCTA
jgi:hypothetical protein